MNLISQMFNAIGNRLNYLSGSDVLFIVCAIVLPPLAVILKVGMTSQFFINIILTILGIVPGQIHALWVVLFM